MLSAHNLTFVAERAATEFVSEPHPQEKLVVASVKHRSILALDMLYFRPSREDQAYAD